MPAYQQGKIYKIISDQTEKIYIGSTTKKLLCQRMANHRDKARKKTHCTSKEIIDYGDAKIILIELFPCASLDELHAREQYHIDQNKEICVNKLKASTGLTKKEYGKQYKKDHKEHIKEYRKQYEKDHRKPCIYCGELVSYHNFIRHCKSEKHISQVEFFDNLFKKLVDGSSKED